MGDQLHDETVREVDSVLERVWAEVSDERRATKKRLRRAHELMVEAEDLLAEMRAAEAQQLETELTELLGREGEAG